MNTWLRLTALALVATATLTGCTQTVALEPAENAIDPGCAEVVVHAPQTVADLAIRETNAQGVVAWGDPSAVILRCGVAEPDPTSTLPCVLVEDGEKTYWLRDDSDAPNYVFTTYGRSPAVEVIINRDVVSPGPALYDLVDAISRTEGLRACTEIEDSLGTPSVLPTPTPTPTVTPTQ
jgi:hypothetical protein